MTPSDDGAGDAGGFVRAHTRVAAVPLVPEVRLHLASEPIELWLRTEKEAGCGGLPPPFWGFAWAGGQALARYVLDHPGVVRGRRVSDLASGCGLVAIAAARAGAGSVTAHEIDRFADAAIACNAGLNGVAVTRVRRDVLDGAAGGGGCPGSGGVVLAGDVFYDREMSRRVLRYLEAVVTAGAVVLVGDPGRAYLPRVGLRAVARYDVAGVGALEDRDVRRTTVWQMDPATVSR